MKDRSQIAVHANNTVNGIITIRSCNSESLMLKEFEGHIDFHTRCYLTFIYLERWFGQKLDFILSFYIAAAIFILILTKGSQKIFNRN